ncbi:MAG: FAD-dependent oxidoreductase [Burkholderiaceae bacterium]|nr:FAD-dependent oxidoreductase [Burkholderiaceae bacterium]
MVAPIYPYVTPPELAAGGVARTQVAIVGAGPVGLACAIDLAQHGVDFIIIDDNNTVSAGSRAICWAKRTLEILDRLGCGDQVCERGVSWKVGKVFCGDQLAYQFDLLPEPGHKRPAFINLQQYLVEEIMVQRLAALGATVRWKNKATAIEQPADSNSAVLEVDTPDGQYTIEADYVIAADGARSPLRDALGLVWKGQVFNDRFLIADVRMKGDFPSERWFWFDPPFHPGGSVLLHRQADDLWRIDFQLGWASDPDEEKKPERVMPRIRAMLGDGRAFELQWVSVYTFQCARLERFVHRRVIFVGDAAHQVSPFGARGANSGIQDADNLCWKLARVVQGGAPASLLESFDDERVQAADENIMNSSRSTDFITPKSNASRVLREAVLALSQQHPFARRIVNSGRLSMPTTHRESALSTPDRNVFGLGPVPGSPAEDAPLRIQAKASALLDQLGGRFDLVAFDDSGETASALRSAVGAEARVHCVSSAAHTAQQSLQDPDGVTARRYGAQPGTVYLFRPDQHVAARWHGPAIGDVRRGLRRAQGLA